jgi:hypothetical protein
VPKRQSLSQLRNLANLGFVFVRFGLFILSVFFVFIIGLVHFCRLQNKRGKGFAKQFAFLADLDALNAFIGHLRDRHRLPAGLQRNDIAWLKRHNLLLW